MQWLRLKFFLGEGAVSAEVRAVQCQDLAKSAGMRWRVGCCKSGVISTASLSSIPMACIVTGRAEGLGGDGVQLAEVMDMRSTKVMSFQIRKENNAGNCALNV